MTAPTLPKPELPSRIPKKDHRWYKGLFVAANVRVKDGVPLFGQVNSDWVGHAWVNRLCQLCGQKIAKAGPLVLPGGPNDLEFSEAPLHVECARYSMLVCPRILARRDTFTFFICKDYHLMSYMLGELEDMGDNVRLEDIVDHIVPKPVRRGTNLHLVLHLAHSDGDGCTQLQRLKYDEFLRWSTR